MMCDDVWYVWCYYARVMCVICVCDVMITYCRCVMCDYVWSCAWCVINTLCVILCVIVFVLRWTVCVMCVWFYAREWGDVCDYVYDVMLIDGLRSMCNVCVRAEICVMKYVCVWGCVCDDVCVVRMCVMMCVRWGCVCDEDVCDDMCVMLWLAMYWFIFRVPLIGEKKWKFSKKSFVKPPHLNRNGLWDWY